MGQKTSSRLEVLWEQRKDAVGLAESEGWKDRVLWSNDRVSPETGQVLLRLYAGVPSSSACSDVPGVCGLVVSPPAESR